MEITEQNFSEFFFDVRTCKPKKGQVIACFTAMAELVNSIEKTNLVELIKNTDKMEAATQVMRKLFHASELDAIRVAKEIAEDLLRNMTVEEILKKPYSYKIEIFYYTEVENVPKDDPHWSVISILNLDEHV